MSEPYYVSTPNGSNTRMFRPWWMSHQTCTWGLGDIVAETWTFVKLIVQCLVQCLIPYSHGEECVEKMKL